MNFYELNIGDSFILCSKTSEHRELCFKTDFNNFVDSDDNDCSSSILDDNEYYIKEFS